MPLRRPVTRRSRVHEVTSLRYRQPGSKSRKKPSGDLHGRHSFSLHLLGGCMPDLPLAPVCRMDLDRDQRLGVRQSGELS